MNKFFIALLILPIMYSCGSIKLEKRRHFRGFHLQWRNQNIQKSSCSETKLSFEKPSNSASTNQDSLIHKHNSIRKPIFSKNKDTISIKNYTYQGTKFVNSTTQYELSSIRKTPELINITHLSVKKTNSRTIPKLNILAILSMILLIGYFTIPIAIILSYISIIQFKRNKGKYRGFVFALIPAIIGICLITFGPILFFLAAVGTAMTVAQSTLLLVLVIIGPIAGIFLSFWLVRTTRYIKGR